VGSGRSGLTYPHAQRKAFTLTEKRTGWVDSPVSKIGSIVSCTVVKTRRPLPAVESTAVIRDHSPAWEAHAGL